MTTDDHPITTPSNSATARQRPWNLRNHVRLAKFTTRPSRSALGGHAQIRLS